MYTLYYAPGAASLLVHWLLIEFDQPCELRRVDTQAGEQKRPEYLALNPNGVVPTLLIDGRPHFEAAALAMTLADRHRMPDLAPAPGEPARADYHQWMFHLANAVQPLFRICGTRTSRPAPITPGASASTSSRASKRPGTGWTRTWPRTARSCSARGSARPISI